MTRKTVAILLMILIILPQSLVAQESPPQSEEKRPLPDLTPIQDYLMSPDGYQLLSTTHDILGYSAVLIGLTAGLLPPDIIDDDLHSALGVTASAAAAMNIGVGFLNYGNRLDVSESLFTIDNIHILMGIAGGALMVLGSFLGESDAHPYIVGAGTALMGGAILLQW